jgi:hypothetical protein
MRNKIKELLVLTTVLTFGIFCLATTGCSVGMALSGKKDPNLGMVRVGATRGEVEMALGNPVSSVTTQDGRRTDIYDYEIGNEPSTGRAVAHGAMDFLTLGLWEVVGTPIEALKGTKYQIAVTYDSDNRVLAINQPAAPNLIKKQSAEATTKENKPALGEQNIEIKLDEINSLKEKGKITDEEYVRMRKDILANASKLEESTKKRSALVSHDSKSYMSKQSVVKHEPSTTGYEPTK